METNKYSQLSETWSNCCALPYNVAGSTPYCRQNKHITANYHTEVQMEVP